MVTGEDKDRPMQLLRAPQPGKESAEAIIEQAHTGGIAGPPVPQVLPLLRLGPRREIVQIPERTSLVRAEQPVVAQGWARREFGEKRRLEGIGAS